LWPGRRWRGREGVADALRACEAVQMDPLNVAARNQDIALWGRVLDYRPQDLYTALYADRAFFEHGGAIFVDSTPGKGTTFQVALPADRGLREAARG
jgi:hypothetical protein